MAGVEQTQSAAVPPVPHEVVEDRRRGITSLRRHTARGMLINSGFEIGVVGLSALRGLIVAGFLTRSEYGIWGVLGLTMWTALGLKNQFGAGNKYVQQSSTDPREAFQTAFTVEIVFALAAAPASLAIVLAYVLISGNSVVLLPGILLLLLLPSTALQFPVSAYYRRMDYRRQRSLQAVEPVIAAIVTISLAASGLGYWSFVAGVLAGSWASAAVALRASPFPFAWRFRRDVLRSYVQFSTPLLLTGLSAIAMFQVIYIVGSDALGLAGLGAFTLVGNFVQFTDQADAIVTQTLYPAICAVRDRTALLSEIFVKSNRLSLMWAVPFGVGLSLFCVDLFRFAIGAKWMPAAPFLEIMGVVTAVNHVGYNWSAFLMARGRTRPIAVASVLSIITLIAAGIPLMYAAGLTGLGWAYVFGVVVSLGVRGMIVRGFFSNFNLPRHLLRAFLPTVIATVPILAARAVYGREQSVLAAAVTLAFYLVVTTLATFALERPLLREAIGYLIHRHRRPTYM